VRVRVTVAASARAAAVAAAAPYLPAGWPVRVRQVAVLDMWEPRERGNAA